MNVPYGGDALGRLKSVIMHAPGEDALKSLPDGLKLGEEQRRLRAALETAGVTVHELADWVREPRLLRQAPELMFPHQAAMICRPGAVLSRPPGREGQAGIALLKESLRRMGVPVWMEFSHDDAFEGGLPLSPGRLLVANTERQRTWSVFKFIREASRHYEEIIYVDLAKARRFAPAHAVFNRIRPDLALAFPPAFQSAHRIRKGSMREIGFADALRERGMELLPVSDEEQKRQACAFIALDSGVMLQQENAFDRETRRRLEKRGVALVPFRGETLAAAGHGLRSLVLRLHREAGQ